MCVLTHHPAQPDLPLRAGESLSCGTVAWIGEDGRVWASRPVSRCLYDGSVVADVALGDPVALLPSAALSARTRAIIDALFASWLHDM